MCVDACVHACICRSVCFCIHFKICPCPFFIHRIARMQDFGTSPHSAAIVWNGDICVKRHYQRAGHGLCHVHRVSRWFISSPCRDLAFSGRSRLQRVFFFFCQTLSIACTPCACQEIKTNASRTGYCAVRFCFKKIGSFPVGFPLVCTVHYWC